ncbi:hypothetical protein CEXT_35851 [Caerostris extrusa]|uniref:Uncharacterized protein n=1 Tax=Caerostris extrusa TaxID=172846 RepID=A0AAV4P5I5_CAEEX|nr:hypothetical protein CEXT_35851 [Caerostris extrusa]
MYPISGTTFTSTHPFYLSQIALNGFPLARQTSAEVSENENVQVRMSATAHPSLLYHLTVRINAVLNDKDSLFFRRRHCSKRHFCFLPQKRKKKGTRQEVKENKVDTST